MTDPSTIASRLSEAQRELCERLENCIRLAEHVTASPELLADALACIRALIDENARLREALQSVLNACDQGRMVELGAGGMTIEAQIRRSVYNRVPAWPIEEARAALSPNPD